MNLRPYIEYLKVENIKEPDGLVLLKEDINLSPKEKNLIYAYCYPRQLMDREFPRRIQDSRKSRNIPIEGTLSPDFVEATLILEAGQTQQYGRFIKHLMHSFCDSDKVFQVSSSEKELDCCICGKSLFGLDHWDTVELFKENPKNQEYLAYGSTESEVILCADCLIQLISAYNLVSEFDPGFLDWTKKFTKDDDVKLDWGDLKLKK